MGRTDAPLERQLLGYLYNHTPEAIDGTDACLYLDDSGEYTVGARPADRPSVSVAAELRELNGMERAQRASAVVAMAKEVETRLGQARRDAGEG